MVYPGPLKFGLIVLSLALSLFLAGLDQTVITTAVPKITDDFHALDDIGWYTAAYLLTTAVFQLAYGKFFTFFSNKIVFLVALCIFELGSLICATAPNSTALIVGRALAGLGAAGLFPGSVLILMHSCPLEKRPTFLGIINAMFGVASICGPFVGGAFTDRVTWRWCFWINLPLGGITLAVVGLCVNTPVNPAYQKWKLAQKLKQFDLLGLVIIIASLICLIMALQWGGAIYLWNDGRVVALLVVFSVLFLTFLASQILFSSSRTVPTQILKNRSVWFAALFAACSSASMFIAITYLPIYFQAIKDSSALASGSMVTPLILGFLLMTLISGMITTVIGYYNPSMIVGPILSSIGAGLITTFQVNTGSPKWIGYQVLLGFGIGFGLQQPLLVVQTILPESEIPVGVALMNLFQMLGGAIFVAVSQNVFQNNLKSDIHAMFPDFDTKSLFSVGATSLSSVFNEEQLKQVLPVYCKDITKTFYIVAALCAASIIGALGTEWRTTKKRDSKNEKA
ncbi:putative efflux pump antibiotic resistance protein [Lepidopterella palustris CBS 459.81]|uniref:Putative efflux pump antibiotic resistance protein n=1 Tax=Lepidopterella palustris CBS 459.81 TaxID=1314670 RepID=A0A8E2ELR5_9PEZI|nr:putative efflux pump antibiotic resistance protein [Lepidopterella palustris CBS 459.81]